MWKEARVLWENPDKHTENMQTLHRKNPPNSGIKATTTPARSPLLINFCSLQNKTGE